MEYDVFISYSRADYIDENKQEIQGNIIRKIKELFDANNITYWLDEQGLSGQEFASLITKKIKASRMFLFVSSKNSNASKWTSNEIAVATHHNKMIIPFRYDNSTYDDSVIMYIAKLDYIEYYLNPNKGLSRLLSAVQGYLKEEADKNERERQEEERRQIELKNSQDVARKVNDIDMQLQGLEQRKDELEQECISHENILAMLKNEKQDVDNNIRELRKTREELLGMNVNITVPNKQNSIIEVFHLKERSWITNIVYIISIIICVLYIYIHLLSIVGSIVIEDMPQLGGINTKIQWWCYHNIMFFQYYPLLYYLYQLLLNRREFIWMIISGVFAIGTPFISSLVYEDISVNEMLFLIFSFFGMLLLILSAQFFRKNKRTAWSLLRKGTFKNDKLQISIFVLMVIVYTISTLVLLIE